MLKGFKTLYDSHESRLHKTLRQFSGFGSCNDEYVDLKKTAPEAVQCGEADTAVTG
jgi:hypothetical protein